ncbi:hypothetical protein M9Y10_035821 [Tritrichomonas musculus]|uniref:DUF3447 domain-containing protein n=2 Tax=Tritrichomonas musculus TaxID=1915356 RepID=A0ABR2GVC1_9EUKA
MESEAYLEKMKKIYGALLDFIESGEDKEILFQELIKLLDNQKVFENPKEIQSFLHIISKVSKNHHCSPCFFSCIERILLNFKEEIKKFVTNSKIFTIFKGNKKIILFLIKEGIIIVDQFVLNELKSDKYFNFFKPEIKDFIDKEKVGEIPENFEIKRQTGENDSYICELIRNDNVEEFCAFCNRSNLSFSQTIIDNSDFETNSFLIGKKPSLIEYAAFFGSIQIFQYLQMNKVELKPSLWLYAIHSKSSELIHLLEENHVIPDDKTYNECLVEAIKCHHNDIARYIKDNLLQIDERNPFDVTPIFFEYYNFEFIQPDLINESNFNVLCRYDYEILVEDLWKKGNIDINSMKIQIIIV